MGRIRGEIKRLADEFFATSRMRVRSSAWVRLAFGQTGLTPLPFIFLGRSDPSLFAFLARFRRAFRRGKALPNTYEHRNQRITTTQLPGRYLVPVPAEAFMNRMRRREPPPTQYQQLRPPLARISTANPPERTEHSVPTSRRALLSEPFERLTIAAPQPGGQPT
jgi:hypothetical protein